MVKINICGVLSNDKASQLGLIEDANDIALFLDYSPAEIQNWNTCIQGIGIGKIVYKIKYECGLKIKKITTQFNEPLSYIPEGCQTVIVVNLKNKFDAFKTIKITDTWEFLNGYAWVQFENVKPNMRIPNVETVLQMVYGLMPKSEGTIIDLLIEDVFNTFNRSIQDVVNRLEKLIIEFAENNNLLISKEDLKNKLSYLFCLDNSFKAELYDFGFVDYQYGELRLNQTTKSKTYQIIFKTFNNSVTYQESNFTYINRFVNNIDEVKIFVKGIKNINSI